MLRKCGAHAWTERRRARQAGDGDAEVRVWKLICVIPAMILHWSRGSVGRDELAKCVDDFDNGWWGQLVELAASVTTRTRSSR